MIKQSLSDWLDYISGTHPADIEMGLDRVKKVYSALSLHPKSSKLVLVAGTNGKGSTIAMIETALMALGFSVGAYTSPHILDYNERVRINAQAVSDAQLVDAFQRVEQGRGDIALTYFEFGTLAAFDLLFSAGLDVLLLEIGLGGRLDAVNIVEPDLSIITSIGLDHTDWLGDTLDDIAYEKAGILRTKTPFIAGENLPLNVMKRAAALACPSYVCRQDFDKDAGKGVNIKAAEKTLHLDHFPQVALPENNILIALQSVACLYRLLCAQSARFDEAVLATVVQAIENVRVPGRLERIALGQEVYLDVGHNPHAAVYLKEYLMHHAQLNKSIQVVYSSLQDKDVRSIAEILAPCVVRWLLAPLTNERAMSLEALQAEVCACSEAEVVSFASVPEAIDSAINLAAEAEAAGQPVLTLIFGSFYMVEAAKRFFKTYE